MGMFDYVNIRCPECGQKLEFQSKAGPCEMKRFKIPGNAPLSVIGDLKNDADKERLTCPHCHTALYIHVQTLVQVYAWAKKEEWEDE